MSNQLGELIHLDIGPDGDSNALGLQVHWRFVGELPQDDVIDALIEAGLPEELLPASPGDGIMLRRAMSAVKKGIPKRKTALTATVVKSVKEGSRLVCTPADHPLAEQLIKEYNHSRTVFECGTDLSVWLTQKIIPYCNGLSGRERGGFYYIPPGEDAQAFGKIVKAIEALSTTEGEHRTLTKGVKFYQPKLVMSEELLESMIDALVDECDKMCETIELKVAEYNSSKSARDRGVQTLQAMADCMDRKIRMYTTLLGISLDDLHERIKNVSDAVFVTEVAVGDSLQL